MPGVRKCSCVDQAVPQWTLSDFAKKANSKLLISKGLSYDEAGLKLQISCLQAAKGLVGVSLNKINALLG